MSVMTAEERTFLDAISRLAYCNPFLPERIDGERQALGRAFTESAEPWNVNPDRVDLQVNVTRLIEQSERMVEALRDRLAVLPRLNDADRRRYDDLVLFVLYHRYREPFDDLMRQMAQGRDKGRDRVSFYRRFGAETERLLDVAGRQTDRGLHIPHLFACFFQLRRAFEQIFSCIIGMSPAAVRLRAEVWQSIFTHDMRRFQRILYARMGDMTCLVTGPSGTGKELVARAIGLARYIPFDVEAQRFAHDYQASFHPLSLSALSPTLIESELFGHKRGAFTGALADHEGWLRKCTSSGAVFLDEIGELDMAIQVKILRVLQSRTFQRIGDTETLPFEGKIIAATNRDLASEVQAGRFREDLYYRLCSDTILTPSLRDQVRDNPGELRHLITHIIQRIVGEADDSLIGQVEQWIAGRLGPTYPWPGNVRELEQCVRNILVRGEYRPLRHAPTTPIGGREALAAEICRGTLTADEMLGQYCALVYASCGSYVETARRLGMDRRTVRRRIDPVLARRLPA